VNEITYFFQTLICKRTLITFGVCLFLAFLVSRRGGFLEHDRQQIVAFLPPLMLCAAFFLLGHSGEDFAHVFSMDICLAFCFGFSLSNLRYESKFSRAIGIVFGLLCVLILYGHVGALLWQGAHHPI
jgi:hypothetical protein